MTHYHIVKNTPGYMPFNDPYAVRTKTEAIAALRDEKRFMQDSDYEGSYRFEGNARNLSYWVTEPDREHDLGVIIQATECNDTSDDCREQLEGE